MCTRPATSPPPSVWHVIRKASSRDRRAERGSRRATARAWRPIRALGVTRSWRADVVIVCPSLLAASRDRVRFLITRRVIRVTCRVDDRPPLSPPDHVGDLQELDERHRQDCAREAAASVETSSWLVKRSIIASSRSRWHVPRACARVRTCVCVCEYTTRWCEGSSTICGVRREMLNKK